MKKTTIIAITAFAALTLFPLQSFAIRCSNGIADVGKIKHEVRMACGEPYSTEVIGYIDEERNGDRITVLKIEEWIVETEAQYYSLVFQGNELTEVKSAGLKR